MPEHLTHPFLLNGSSAIDVNFVFTSNLFINKHGAKSNPIESQLSSDFDQVRDKDAFAHTPGHQTIGRKSVYVNPAHNTHFVGWSELESAPLLNYLFAHQVRPELTCRFNWR